MPYTELCELYSYLYNLKIAKSYNSDSSSIGCSCTSEAMLSLIVGLNWNDRYIYRSELIGLCTFKLIVEVK